MTRSPPTTSRPRSNRLDESKARIRLKGRVEGSAFGGTGAIGCDGFATFDREAGRLDRLDLNRVETRQAGPVEAGLDMKSTLIVTRHPADPPEALADSALAGVPLGGGRDSELFADHLARRACNDAGRPQLAHLLGGFPDGDLETARRRPCRRSVQPHGRPEGAARDAIKIRPSSATTFAAA